jgi:hypothetical protein
MLIFDYDGVLMDSVREIAVTAYNMLTGTITTRLKELPQNALRLFLRNRFHVQPIGDAPVLMKWCLENGEHSPDKLLSSSEYNEILKQADEPVAMRTSRFYQMRNRFKTRHVEAWMALNAPVQPLWDVMVENFSKNLVLLTNKNREATISLSHHFGLAINENNVYSGDNGITKIENMTQIMQRFRQPAYAFIDDSVKNLRELDEHFNRHETVLSLIYAEWGYVGPNDAHLARRRGYHSPSIEQFMDQLQSRL